MKKMAIEMTYFQTFSFVKESDNSFEFVRSEEELDEFYTFGDYFDVIETAKALGLEDVFRHIVPYTQELDYFVDAKEKKALKEMLISPAECLKINEEYQLFDRLLHANPEFDIYLQSVLNNWKKNRYVIIHSC